MFIQDHSLHSLMFWIIKIYNNETKLCSINSEYQIKLKNKKEDILYNGECQNIMEILKDEIKEYAKIIIKIKF